MDTRKCGVGRRLYWVLGIGLIAACSAAVPASRCDAKERNQTATATPEIVDRGAATPKALLESMAALVDKNAPSQTWMGFQPPANQPLAKTQLELAAQLGAKAESVTKLVQKKIGQTEANMVQSMQKGVQAGWEMTLQYQLSQITRQGKVDWTKTKITEDGDKAAASLSAGQRSILFAKADGKWYLGDGEGNDSIVKDLPGLKKSTEAMLKTLDTLEQKINAGQITKSNFIQEYVNLVNESADAGKP